MQPSTVQPKTTAFIFPGQGSQKVGMGKDFFDAYPAAKQVFEEVDAALGKPLSQIIFNGPQEDLNLTENTQAAIMATSIAIFRSLNKDITEVASFVAGHSLGEYSALCAAGALSLTDTAKLLQIRGRAMQAAVPVGQGSMAAILGLSFEDVESVANEAGCEAANDNAEGQVVISGSKDAVAKACELAKAKGAKRAVELPVSAPFHCRLMQPAADVMADALAKVTINAPKVPLVANVTAALTTNPDEIRQLLVRQVTGRVRWRESVKFLKTQGIDTLIEIGYGKVLTGLTKRIEETMGGNCIQTIEDLKPKNQAA
jgi:[acyl-carrier-protein] S-malonyltransferase